jgi:hypothetical protein
MPRRAAVKQQATKSTKKKLYIKLAMLTRISQPAAISDWSTGRLQKPEAKPFNILQR